MEEINNDISGLGPRKFNIIRGKPYNQGALYDYTAKHHHNIATLLRYTYHHVGWI